MMTSMSPHELYEEVAAELRATGRGEYEASDILHVVRALEHVVYENVSKGRRVPIRGLVTFKPTFVHGRPRRKVVIPYGEHAGETTTAKARPGRIVLRTRVARRLQAMTPSMRSNAGRALAHKS